MIELPDPAAPGPRPLAPLSEINVTPMVDVMLVLLIIFMVAAPLMVAGVKVDLPKAKAAARLEPEKPVVVNVLPDGGLTVDAKPVTEAQLAALVLVRLGGAMDQPVYVAGDQAAPYGRIIAAIDRLAAAGLSRVVLVAERGAVEASAAGQDHSGHDMGASAPAAGN